MPSRHSSGSKTNHEIVGIHVPVQCDEAREALSWGPFRVGEQRDSRLNPKGEHGLAIRESRRWFVLWTLCQVGRASPSDARLLFHVTQTLP